MPTKRLKTRLNRKCGGSRRQVQAHFDGLRKMRPINADNSRELEIFPDKVERIVVSLKESKKFADLEGGTSYTIVLGKRPQALYLASTTDGLKRGEVWILLTSCVTRFLRRLSTRYKHQILSMFLPVLEMHKGRAQASLLLIRYRRRDTCSSL